MDSRQYPFSPESSGRRGGPRASCRGFPTWLGRKLLSAAFELLYGGLAPAYDVVSWVVSGGRWRSWQREALDGLPDGRILEVGSGTGCLLIDLLSTGRDAYGLDLSPAMLRSAQRRLASGGFGDRLVLGDARRLPFPDGAFDCIVLTFPSPYIDASFWSEAERVLPPGGRLVAVIAAESRAWPWPGALEWALARLAGYGGAAVDEELTLAPRLRGRTLLRARPSGGVRVLIAERE